ncbi:MAG: type I polyketide synthase, partial [Acidobacteriota bacterium]
MSETNTTGSEIAVVGMACRFPGARTPEEFWRNLCRGVESIQPLSEEQLRRSGVSQADLDDPRYVRAAPLLADFDRFDASFFGYNALEARLMDPQQRLLLECSWEALERAGYDPATYGGAIGVFAGTKTNTYLFHLASRPEQLESMDFLQLVLGGDQAMLSTRISYKLDLKGPSYGLQTACSTSLVAVHLACQSLLIDECQMALAGGVAINVPHEVGYRFDEGGILSPDGHCRPFDAQAAGTVFGSGLGFVVLKRLEDALADGDHIHAVILGSATNNDGAHKASFTAPSVEGQTRVILEALACSGVEAESISYVEAHGTGTAVGDPMEILALSEAYSSTTDRRGFCAVGSVKSNVGHLDAAAGISSLIKTVLALEHGELPPTLHYDQPNPRIDFAASPFYVQSERTPWPERGGPRRAAVSSLGFGGTNAHLILQQAPAANPAVAGAPRQEASWQLLTLSGRTLAALDAAGTGLADHLDAHSEVDLADAAYTLKIGRQAFVRRRVVVCREGGDAARLLRGESVEGGLRYEAAAPEGSQRPIFLFPGQGSQYVGMGQDLYRREAVFRREVDRFCEVLRPELNCDLRELLYPDHFPGRADDVPAAERLTETRYAQPALFVVELALARLWMSWGVTPRAMLGHSLGEYVAACLAEVLTVDEALALVAIRGRLMQELPRGAMVAVAASEEELQAHLGDDLALAVINGPQRSVVAGPEAAINDFSQRMTDQGSKVRRLHTSHAFHSPMMEPILEPFAQRLREVRWQAPRIPYVSNLTGHWIRPEEAMDADYWVRHLRHTVRFADGLTVLFEEPGGALLEVGPGNTLSALARRHPSYGEASTIASMRHASDRRPDLATLLAAQGQLWLAGVPIDWQAVYAGETRRRVPLPTYPFDRRRHWIDLAEAPPRAVAAPTKNEAVEDWLYRSVWAPAEPPAEAPSSEARRWLLLIDEDGIGATLAENLEARGEEIVRVAAGDAAVALDDGSFRIDPASEDDYGWLLRRLSESARQPQNIVHLWSLSATAEDGPAIADDLKADFDRQQAPVFYSVLFLARALVRDSASMHLDIVTADVYPVRGTESLSPHRATVLGPCLVLSQEYPNVTCRQIDLTLEAAESIALAAQVTTELLADARSTAESGPQVAYRDGQRWIRRFESAALPAADQASRLRSRGVYLITGGLGLVGSTLATELASAAEARLALVGRTELPPRDDWRAFIEEHGGDHPVSRKISTVTALEQAGGEVLVLAADVTDLEAMRQAVTETRRHFGALHGVLHAAGEASGPAFQAIPRSGREECAAHFGPKVLGALVLERVLTEGAESDELDFVLLNSSLSAVLGGLGNVAYTAANAFLDTLAAARNSSGGTAWLSVDWDAWLDADGLGSDAADAVDVGAALQELSIEPTQGGEFFRRLLAAPPESPWIVSTGDLQQRLAQWVLRPLRQAASSSQRATDRSPLSAGELENQIVDIWRSVLDLETMGRDENFFDLGGNSLSGMQLVGEIERRLGVQVAPVALFEAPTVRALTHKLLGELGEAGGDETASSTEAGAQSPDRTSDDGEDLVGDEGDAIAVVGMACRFPGADSVEAYWRNLRDGVESITFFDDDQLSAVDPQLLDDPAYVKARPVLDDAECFDAALFGYSPREAERMDPQHRVFLELAWEALENAGHDPARHKEAIGVFAGAAISTYLFNLHAAGEVDPEDPLQTVVGNDKDSLTTSVSYKLDLKGPSIAVQSFCSTSLVAVHLAVRSLRAGECRMALAGGVSVAVPQATGYRFQEGGILSPDGHCRPFDAAANGTLFGNGAGIVALKRLRDAIADGDRVYALVRGTAINNDGSLKVGYTAPSVSGQADVVTRALADAGVSPETIGYVEAHGTGTDMGDPVEVAALTQAFNPTQGESREPGWCALGSVKGNVGHLDRAAGVASLIKAILTLDRQEIPPSLHFENPNPKIDFDRSPFFVNAELRPWQTNGRPRRAGVSALGFGGTNAHVVLEEAPGSAASEPSARGSELLVLSAASEGVLDQAADRLATFLEERPETPLGDVAFSLQVGRRELDHRQAWVCTDTADAVAKLRASRRPSKTEGGQRPVVFLFPGQGAQYLHMGAELYRCERTFRRELDRCAEILEPHLEVDLRHLLYPEAPDDDAEMRLAQTRFAQPALFAVEYALARLWMEWGVEPEAMLGHSIGEYVAACLAGVFTLEDALALVAARGRLMQAQPGGSMLAVSLPEAETVELLDLAGLSLAAVNARDRCVVAGADALIEQLAAQLTERGVAHRGLHTSHAFHSSMLEPAVEPFCDAVHGIDRSQPGRRFISCVTGTWIEASQIEDPGYWGSQLRQTVRFADGIETLCQGSPAPILLEVGPGNGLSRLIGRHLAARRDDEGGVDLPPATTVASMRHPKEQTSDVAVVQQALGRLWLAGQTIDWEGVHGPGHPRRVSLPTYPFERQRFWIEADSADPTGLRAGRYPSQWLFTPSWRRTQSPKPVEVPSDQPDAWLVLSDGGELGDALSRSLAELQAVKGGQVTVALAGERFAARDSST